ncbi:MAG: hypothetical protein ACI9YB_001955, partial [Halioglobus sp.]
SENIQLQGKVLAGLIQGAMEITIADVTWEQDISKLVEEDSQETLDNIAADGDELDKGFVEIVERMEKLEETKQYTTAETFRTNFV